jgi:hypothetical protein
MSSEQRSAQNSSSLPPAPSLHRAGRHWFNHQVVVIAALCLVLGIAAAVRLRLLDFPLERDEGEYAYMGQQILQGTPPYRESCNMKWPGTYMAYAAIMAIFGQTPAGIHTGLILVNLTGSLLLFVLARRIGGPWCGCVAAGFNALVSLSEPTLGLAGHATHFVVVFALAGLVQLTERCSAITTRQAFAAGVFFGLATLMKQPGAGFGVFAVAWLVWREFVHGERRGIRLAQRLVAIGCGGTLPLAITALWLWWSGAWPEFWRWTVLYAGAYATQISPANGLLFLRYISVELWQGAPWLWGLSCLGLPALFCHRPLQPWRSFVAAFAVFSFAAVCPGLYFRGHYFLLFLPAAGLLAGIATVTLTEWASRWSRQGRLAALPALLVVSACGQALWTGRTLYFHDTPDQACSRLYRSSPFVASLEIGRYLRTHAGPQARIAVIGSEPQICFYAQRRSATRFLYTYPLMEHQPLANAMRQQFIREVETTEPDYAVFIRTAKSWGTGPSSSPEIFRWFERYQAEQLEPVGLVETTDDGRVSFNWSVDGKLRPPRSLNAVTIFRRRPLATP